jgi:hypothetical protein
VVAGDVVQAPNDKQQLEPMLAKTSALPEELGKVETLLGDNGYFSEANVKACKAAAIEPLLAMGRDSHHPSLSERFAGAPAAPENPTPVEAMAHRLQTPEGKKLYALRKHTPNRCSASSNRCLDSVSFCCVAWKTSKASGIS